MTVSPQAHALVNQAQCKRWRAFGFSLYFVVSFAFLFLAAGCNRATRPPVSKVVEVVITTPITDDVTDYQDFTGRLDAFMTVDIRPRVSGYVEKAHFVEGQVVHEGDLLFQIDPRTYKAEFDQAEANLKLAKADVLLQTRKLERGRQLVNSRTGAISPEDYDQLIAGREKAIATVGAMEATRDRAKLYFDFTRVTSPLTGRISRRLVDPGNLVNADQTVLTTIVTEDPMYVYFDVDERTYLDLVAMTSPSSSSWFSALRFPVMMRLANEEEFVQKGFVNFLDNRLNGNTGTVRMRGVFDNPKNILKSGLFARVRLPIGIPYKTLLIPDEAIQSDQGRKYVFVVKPAKDDQGKESEKVEYRAVTLGQSIQGLRAIKEGLDKDEHIIVSGMQRVRAGAVVQTKMQEPPKAPKSSLTRQLTESHSTTPSGGAPAVAPSLKDMPRLEQHGAHSHGKSRR